MFCTSSDEENCLLDAILSRQELSSPDAVKHRPSRYWDENVLCELHTRGTGCVTFTVATHEGLFRKPTQCLFHY